MIRPYLIIFMLTFLSCFCYSQEAVFLSIISTKDELDLTDISLVAIPTQGPFMLAGNELHSLVEDNETTAIVFPEEMYVEDVIWTGEDFAIKSRHEVYMLSNVEEPVFVFEEEDFKIFPWNEENIFIVYHAEGKDLVFRASLKHKRVKRLISLDEKVVYVTSMKDATLITTTENIYLFTKNECVRYMNLWSSVRTAIMTNKGLFFATDQETCILIGVDSFVLLFDAGCRQLLFDGSDLYLLTESFDLLKCDISLLGSFK